MDQITTQIDPAIYMQVLENWGAYSRRDGLKKLGYGSQSHFYSQSTSNGNTLEPNEHEALQAEKALLSMMVGNQFYAEWLKHKYYIGLSDYQMSKDFRVSLTKSKQNKMTALALFGMCYEQEKNAC